MEVSFANRGLQRACSSAKESQKRWGERLARKLQQRLMELKAADTLSDICHVPPARCHELGGSRAGQLSVDLDHPYQLIFVPDYDPAPRKPDGGLDRTRVTRIVVLEVCDTH